MLEHLIVFALCIILLTLGIPSAVSRNSIFGWILSVMGGAGIVALVINSIISHDESPRYDCFLIGVFFLFIAFGISAGIFTGTIEHSLSLGVLVGAAGLLAGYPLGILAGLWFQRLGWMALMVNQLSILAILGMVIVDLVLLSGSLF